MYLVGNTLYCYILCSELVGNCDVHCRIVEVLLRKGPWSESKLYQ